MLKILPLRLGKSYGLRADTGKIILNAYELFRLRVRQRLQQRRIYQAKNCSGRSNAEGNCQNGDGGEPGRFPEDTQTEAEVLQENVDEISGDRFPAFLFEPLSASELDARPALGFSAVQPRTFKVSCAMLHV